MKNLGFRHYAELLSSALQLMDLLIVLISFLVAHAVRFGTIQAPAHHLVLIVVVLLLINIVFKSQGIYKSWRGNSDFSELKGIVIGIVLVILSLALIGSLTQTSILYSRLWIGLGMGFTIIALVCFRKILRLGINSRRSFGYNYRSVLVVGAGELGASVADKLAVNSWSGLKVIGFLDDSKTKLPITEQHCVLGTCSDAHDVVEQFRLEGRPIDQVWITLPGWAHDRAAGVVDSLSDSATTVMIVPDLFSLRMAQASIESIASIPLISLSERQNTSVNYIIKPFFDYLIAVVAIFLLSPLMLIVALLIKWDSKGPVFFKQKRYGLDGCEILVWKFRTMQVLENDEIVTQASRNDARVTRIGRFLRSSSLDELPQLFNVLEGDMSLVGPRPHAVAHNEIYRKKIKGYTRRHIIKPGITGLAQVSGCRGETETVEKMQKRIDYDLVYISRWSIYLDIKILLLTVRQIVNFKNVY